MLDKKIVNPAQYVLRKFVIRIHKVQEPALCILQPLIACGGYTAIFLMDHLDIIRILFRIPVADRTASVR